MIRPASTQPGPADVINPAGRYCNVTITHQTATTENSKRIGVRGTAAPPERPAPNKSATPKSAHHTAPQNGSAEPNGSGASDTTRQTRRGGTFLGIALGCLQQSG